MTDLPEGWEWSTMADVADVALGRQRSPQHHHGPNMRPYLRSANVTWRGIDISDVKEMNFDPADAAMFELAAGDLLLNEASGSAGEVGKPAIWRGEIEGCCFQNTLLRVRTRGPLVEYVYWYCMSAALAGQFGDAGRGVNIRHLGKQGLAAFRIPVPPLSEQRRIAASIEEHLSRLEAAQGYVRSGRIRLDTLRKSVITEVLTRERSSIASWGDVGQTLSGRAFPSSAYTDDGVLLLRPGNLAKSGRVMWGERSTTRLPLSFAVDFPKYVLRGRHLLMNLTAQSLADDFLGRVCLSSEQDEFLLNQRIARLHSSAASNEYLYWVFRSGAFRSYVATLNTGSLIQHISTRQLDAFMFPLPPVDAQNRLVEEINETVAGIDRLESLLMALPRRADGMRRSILAAAFSGQLVAQDPDDEPASELLKRIRAERAAAAPKTRSQKVNAS